MIIQCPKCSTRFSISEEAIANIVAPQFHCSRCSNYFTLAENAYDSLSTAAPIPQPKVAQVPSAETDSSYPDEFEEFAVEKFAQVDSKALAKESAAKSTRGKEPSPVDSFFNPEGDSEEIAQQLDLIDDQSNLEAKFSERSTDENFNFSSFSEADEDETSRFTAQWPAEESDSAEVWTQPVVSKKKWGSSASWSQEPAAPLEQEEEELEEEFEEDEEIQEEEEFELDASEEDELEDEDEEIEEDEEFEEELEEEEEEEEEEFEEEEEILVKPISPEKLEKELYNFFPDQDNDAPDNFTATFGDFSDREFEDSRTSSGSQQFGQVLDFPPAFAENPPSDKQAQKKVAETKLSSKASNSFSAIALVCSAPLLLLIALGVLSNQEINNSFALSQLRSIFEPDLPSAPPSGVEIIDLTSRIQPLNDGLRVIEISGSIYNATLETFRDVAVRAQVFSNENHFVSEVIAPADNSLLNASIRTLDIHSLEELQQKPSSSEGLIRPNEKLPFKLILATTSGGETWFSTKVHSVLAATTERLLRD